MLVANSFDLWQKDAFFSAAEEVQQSADIMESAFRRFMKARTEGSVPQHLEELERELQMALGTAKWQLEEFERAVSVSYKSHGNDITVSRHRDFVSAMKEQISHVEITLKQHFDAEGKKPFRWVNLNKQECDDLALFLSGVSQPSPLKNPDESMSFQTLATGSLDHGNSPLELSSEEVVVTSNDEKHYLTDQIEGRSQATEDLFSYQADRKVGTHRTRGSSHQDMMLEIVIDRDDKPMDPLLETTPKEKASKVKPFFWLSRSENNTGANVASDRIHLRSINWLNQYLRTHQLYRPQRSPLIVMKSIRAILILVLTIVLVVPFLVYSA